MTRRLHGFSWVRVWAMVWICISSAAQAQAPSLVMASTTSTEQSGLFAHLLPAFKQASGIDIKVVALGTGQALDTGRRGDADVLFVHDQAAEEKFVAEGFGVKRYPVMYNDFVLVGPANDPAKTPAKTLHWPCKKLAAHRRALCRVVTRVARMPPNCAIGSKQDSTTKVQAIKSAGAAWGQL